MNESLKSAQSSLHIQAVNLRDSKISVRSDIEISTIDRSNTVSQVYRAVIQIQEASFSDAKEKEHWVYSFIYTSGIRLIFLEEEESSKEEAYKPVMEIVGDFSAKYFSKSKLSQEEVDIFCEDSVGYHVWPYWREYVQSTCSRIGLSPTLEVPIYFMPQNGEKV